MSTTLWMGLRLTAKVSKFQAANGDRFPAKQGNAQDAAWLARHFLKIIADADFLTYGAMIGHSPGLKQWRVVLDAFEPDGKGVKTDLTVRLVEKLKRGWYLAHHTVHTLWGTQHELERDNEVGWEDHDDWKHRTAFMAYRGVPFILQVDGELWEENLLELSALLQRDCKEQAEKLKKDAESWDTIASATSWEKPLEKKHRKALADALEKMAPAASVGRTESSGRPERKVRFAEEKNEAYSPVTSDDGKQVAEQSADGGGSVAGVMLRRIGLFRNNSF
ncbi:uncharacterized protein DSM5745_11384 [Aspergillus mulundensis]|uniref:Uncharacterized protein n=1 Tax=Aspergillus mulundensis TaxID=1810919 RepID=A0A3D8Q7Q5_9EURO|nr:hypothetical protein DSM5745_11384 [Aspergillus mulundensis]RDW57866.1 hypothetical protein DSM5745_11384 [Aspergillus mulundensis]